MISLRGRGEWFCVVLFCFCILGAAVLTEPTKAEIEEVIGLVHGWEPDLTGAEAF